MCYSPFFTSMKPIKNIIFDLGGVLLNIDYDRTRQAFEDLGISRFEELYNQAAANDLFSRLEIGAISNEDFYQELNHIAGLSLHSGQIEKAWNAMLLDFREESLQWIVEIKPHYNLFVLSNTNSIHLKAFNEIYHSRSRNKEFEVYFDKVLYSFEIGCRKPDIECFEKTIEILDINPHETLFVDDSPQNTESAKKSGIHTIHLKPGEKIEKIVAERL